ncbi:MAG: type II secretion system F family protein [Bacillota bacterium]|nr:type II secretion system F family protein [Bacillota bacterium]
MALLLAVSVFLLVGTLLSRRRQPFSRRRKSSWWRLPPFPARVQESQLPSLLLDLATSLKAGLTLAAALRSLPRQGPFGARVEEAVARYELGAPLDEALEDLLLPEGEAGRWVGRALKAHRQLGGDVAPLLLELAGAIQKSSLQRREWQAKTAEARMTGYLLAALPPLLALALFFLNPQAWSAAWEEPQGRWALLYALFSWFLGAGAIVWLLTTHRERKGL